MIGNTQTAAAALGSKTTDRQDDEEGVDETD